MKEPKLNRVVALIVGLAVLSASCAADSNDDVVGAGQQSTVAPEATTETSASSQDEAADESSNAAEEPATAETQNGDESTYEIEVWADNWMAVYVNGELVGEDSVPITTERSFNAEAFTFNATTPFTVAIEAKDFKETDSGLEYIGERNQQMGDGGVIAQITDTATGALVGATDESWRALVIHRAPLNTECEGDSDPDATCQSEITEAPANWVAADFDDSGWTSATEWSESAVSPKDGYDQISWDETAMLIWGTDLEVDNTVLLRSTVGA